MTAGLAYILDADPAEAATIAAIAEGSGLTTRTFRVTQDFLDAIAHMAPSHIILDLMMPEIDGVEVIRRLCQISSRARLVIQSAVGTRVLDAAERLAIEQGLPLQGTLAKPYAPHALSALLEDGSELMADAETSTAGTPSERSTITAGRLRAALDCGAVSVVYQPKIDCMTGTLIGVETLAAWHRQDGTRIPPEWFVTLAERSGLIDTLTWQVVDQALDWLKALDRPDLSMAINISARSLESSGIVDDLVARCAAHGIDTGSLILEMTETAAMRDPLRTLDVLTRLRLRGFRVSIDDFGIGYSSLAQLARLPFSELKVDRAFVRGLVPQGEHHTIVRAIIGLGRSLGLVVAAEGVETAAALDCLRSLGCDHAQGFHIAPPLPPAEAAALITENGLGG